MNKTRLALNVLSGGLYIAGSAFILILAANLFLFQDNTASGAIDTEFLDLFMFILISIGYGGLIYLIPFALALISLILTIRLNKLGASYRKGIPIALITLPVATYLALIVIIILITL